MTKWICNKCMLGTPCSLYFIGTATPRKICPFTGTGMAEWRTEQKQKQETELPDWCKVGEWVYSIPAQKYDKIIAIQDFRIVTREMKYTDDYINDGNVVQARLRPYNAEEMKALVGKVVSTKRDCGIITGYRGEDNKVIVAWENIRYSAEALLEIGATIDGAPCGKLEHLEDGEWKE